MWLRVIVCEDISCYSSLLTSDRKGQNNGNRCVRTESLSMPLLSPAALHHSFIATATCAAGSIFIPPPVSGEYCRQSRNMDLLQKCGSQQERPLLARKPQCSSPPDVGKVIFGVAIAILCNFLLLWLVLQEEDQFRCVLWQGARSSMSMSSFYMHQITSRSSK